jgi:hypothetical protein
MPKHENFSLAFLHKVNPSGPVTKGLEKIEIFYQLTPDFDGFGFLPHTECAVNTKKF